MVDWHSVIDLSSPWGRVDMVAAGACRWCPTRAGQGEIEGETAPLLTWVMRADARDRRERISRIDHRPLYDSGWLYCLRSALHTCMLSGVVPVLDVSFCKPCEPCGRPQQSSFIQLLRRPRCRVSASSVRSFAQRVSEIQPFAAVSRTHLEQRQTTRAQQEQRQETKACVYSHVLVQ